MTENNGFSFVNGDWQKTIKEEYQYDNNNRLAYVRSFSNIKGEFKKIVGKGIRYTDKGNSDFFEQDRFLNIEFNWQIWQIMRYGQVKSTTPS